MRSVSILLGLLVVCAATLVVAEGADESILSKNVIAEEDHNLLNSLLEAKAEVKVDAAAPPPVSGDAAKSFTDSLRRALSGAPLESNDKPGSPFASLRFAAKRASAHADRDSSHPAAVAPQARNMPAGMPYPMPRFRGMYPPPMFNPYAAMLQQRASEEDDDDDDDDDNDDGDDDNDDGDDDDSDDDSDDGDDDDSDDKGKNAEKARPSAKQVAKDAKSVQKLFSGLEYKDTMNNMRFREKVDTTQKATARSTMSGYGTPMAGQPAEDIMPHFDANKVFGHAGPQDPNAANIPYGGANQHQSNNGFGVMMNHASEQQMFGNTHPQLNQINQLAGAARFMSLRQSQNQAQHQAQQQYQAVRQRNPQPNPAAGVNPQGTFMPYFPASAAPPPAPNQVPVSAVATAPNVYPNNMQTPTTGAMPFAAQGMTNSPGVNSAASVMNPGQPGSNQLQSYPFGGSFIELESSAVHPEVDYYGRNPHHSVGRPITDQHLERFPELE
jgi:hypothetical protein